MFTVYLIIGALSGALSGLLGIGGGIIVVPGLAAVFMHSNQFPHEDVMQMAIGTSLAAMIVTTGSALLAHSRRGSVRWDIVKKMLPGLMGGAVIGAIIANYLPSEGLRIFFSLFLFYAAFRLLFVKYVRCNMPFSITLCHGNNFRADWYSRQYFGSRWWYDVNSLHVTLSSEITRSDRD